MSVLQTPTLILLLELALGEREKEAGFLPSCGPFSFTGKKEKRREERKRPDDRFLTHPHLVC